MMKWFHDESPGEFKRKVCANCKQEYIEGDRYCRYCGAPLGKPEFIEDDLECIYGPEPTERLHICKVCGYQWTTIKMVDRERRCPRCGGPAPVSGEDDLWDIRNIII